MLGKTNAVIGTGGGGGATVTAINKTGATITAGSKVWINENVQTQGSSYQFAGVNEEGYLSRSGNFAYNGRDTFSITNESATNVGKVSAGSGKIRYMADNSVFANYGRVDEVAQYSLSTSTTLLGDDYFGFDSKYNRINMTDGSVIQSWTIGSGASSTLVADTCKVGNYFYRLTHNTSYMTKVTLNDDGTATGVKYNYSPVDSNSRYPIGVTIDNKYIVAASSGSNLSSSGYLRIVEVIDEDNFKELPQSEMPAELQKYFSTAKGFFVFNPYTGILTAVDSTSIDYVVMKYENGEWKAVPVTLDLPEDITAFISGLVVSDDLSRASISYKATQYGSSSYAHIVNLTTTEGYVAVPYRFYNINENTITGYASNDTEPDMEAQISVASMPKIDTGSSDVIVPYEIDYNKVTIVNDYGTLEFSSNDNGNVTVLTGFDGSSGFWFNDAPMFGIDETLEYQFKFRMNDEHRAALAGTVALGNFQSSSEGKVEFSSVLDANLIGISISEDFKGSSKIYLDTTQIIGEWVTVNIRVNEEGNWQIYADKGVVDSYTTTDARGSLTIPLNYYILFGNNYERTPNISVDLEETGFKQNGEWVYRCVKQI